MGSRCPWSSKLGRCRSRAPAGSPETVADGVAATGATTGRDRREVVAAGRVSAAGRRNGPGSTRCPCAGSNATSRAVDGCACLGRPRRRTAGFRGCPGTAGPAGRRLRRGARAGHPPSGLQPAPVLVEPRREDRRRSLRRAGKADGPSATGLQCASSERILGRPLSPSSYVYSLAALAYRCLTGADPFPPRARSGGALPASARASSARH
jgi:hypothetical protein